MNSLFLITGGNIGNRKQNLQLAAQHIEQRIGNIRKSSSLYETAAWGNTNQPSFYNQVHIVATTLNVQQTMATILKIEKEMGRIRTVKNAARIIDIDILFFNDAIINTGSIIIPHKEIPNRRFVLMPLNELAPDWIHPALKKNMDELLSACEDELAVAALSITN